MDEWLPVDSVDLDGEGEGLQHVLGGSEEGGVKGKKTYLSDENGEPLGARWYDLWMTPDGKVVRKGRLWSADELANESSDKAN